MRKIFFVLFFVMLYGAHSIAQEEIMKVLQKTSGQKLELGKKQKTEVTCDGALEVDYENNIAVFNENVIVNDPQLMIKADKMQVFFDKESKSIDKIVCEGNVKFKKEDRQAKSDKAVYLAKQGKVILTGDPMVKRGMDALTGEKITFFRNDNRMICEPSAKLVIYSEEREEEQGEWW